MSLKTPLGVVLPTESPHDQRLPSGAAVIGPSDSAVVGNSVISPAGVIRPIELGPEVNQRLPSAPVAMKMAVVPAGVGYSVIWEACADCAPPSQAARTDAVTASNSTVGPRRANGRDCAIEADNPVSPEGCGASARGAFLARSTDGSKPALLHRRPSRVPRPTVRWLG